MDWLDRWLKLLKKCLRFGEVNACQFSPTFKQFLEANVIESDWKLLKEQRQHWTILQIEINGIHWKNSCNQLEINWAQDQFKRSDKSYGIFHWVWKGFHELNYLMVNRKWWIIHQTLCSSLVENQIKIGIWWMCFHKFKKGKICFCIE